MTEERIGTRCALEVVRCFAHVGLREQGATQRALDRRNYVLREMVSNGFITPEVHESEVVLGYEGLDRVLGVFVDGASDHLFARSGFAEKQHGGISRRHSLNLSQNLF